MRILWVGTKPPRPPDDGGRLVALTTIAALATAGHAVTVVAPAGSAADASVEHADDDIPGVSLALVPAVPPAWPLAAVRGLVRRLPVTIARHTHTAVGACVERVLASTDYDVVHAEQMQALHACTAATARGLPILLRTQNVESELWEGRAVGSRVLRYEARRLAHFEGAAVRSAAATVALTARDAARLSVLAGAGAHVHHVPAPFPADGRTAGPALPGAPAIVLPGSTGWPPNDEAIAWFRREVWPRVAAKIAGARLHAFAIRPARDRDGTVTWHPPPADSAGLFPAGALVVVPLRTPIGVRMRILEAWARGLPVVATPAAVAGLDPGAERAVVIAHTADEIASALAALAADPAQQRRITAAGRALLRAHHDPTTIAATLTGIYRTVASAARARS